MVLKKHYHRTGVSRPIFHLPPASSLPPLHIISFTNFSFTPRQAADWASCLGQRHIHYLGLDGTAECLSPLIDSILASIHTLNSLAIRISDGTDSGIAPRLNSSLDRLLSQNPALTSLAAYDFSTDILCSVIKHHGNNLRDLRFRRTTAATAYASGIENNPAVRYYSSATVPRDNECIFSRDELRELARQLPAVTRLGIDLSFKFGLARSSS